MWAAWAAATVTPSAAGNHDLETPDSEPHRRIRSSLTLFFFRPTYRELLAARWMKIAGPPDPYPLGRSRDDPERSRK